MPGLLRGIARTAVVAGTATAVSGRVHDVSRDAGRPRKQAAPASSTRTCSRLLPRPLQYAARSHPAPTEHRATCSTSCKQLGQLRDAGVLTDAEFQEQKDRILYG